MRAHRAEGHALVHSKSAAPSADERHPHMDVQGSALTTDVILQALVEGLAVTATPPGLSQPSPERAGILEQELRDAVNDLPDAMDRLTTALAALRSAPCEAAAVGAAHALVAVDLGWLRLVHHADALAGLDEPGDKTRRMINLARALAPVVRSTADLARAALDLTPAPEVPTACLLADPAPTTTVVAPGRDLGGRPLPSRASQRPGSGSRQQRQPRPPRRRRSQLDARKRIDEYQG